MRILEYGHIKPKVIKCRYCGAVLEYVSGDIKRFRGDSYLKCPVCQGSNALSGDATTFKFGGDSNEA